MSAQLSDAWFVKIGADTFGPYAVTRMQRFIHEGRVKPTTMVSRSRDGDFTPVWTTPGLEELVGPPSAAPVSVASPGLAAARPTEPAPSRPASSPPPGGRATAPAHVINTVREVLQLDGADSVASGVRARAQPDVGGEATPARTALTVNFIVVVQAIDSVLDKVEAALAEEGALVRAAPGVWFLRAAESAHALRNRLSRLVGSKDALIVVDTSRDDPAWFNVGMRVDAAIRELRDPSVATR